MIDGGEQGEAVVQRSEAVETHGVEPLEDVAILPVLRRAAVLRDEPLNLLEAGDDPLLAGRPARLILRLDLDAKLFEQRIILVGELSHSRPPPSCGRGRPRPPPCASPRRRWR